MPLTLGTNPDAFGIWTLADRERFPWPQWLDAVAVAGYRTVELGSMGYLPTDGAAVRGELESRGLTLTAGYLSQLTADARRRDEVFEQLHRLAPLVAAAGGTHLLGIPAFVRTASGESTAPRRLDDASWSVLATLLDDVANACDGEYGLRLAFHPHMDTAVETPEDIERFLSSTGDHVGLCLDTGQTAYHGTDPADLLRRWPDRVTYVHLRDLDPDVTARCRAEDTPFPVAVQRGVFCDPGTGLLDFESFTAAVHDVGFDGPTIVERSLLGSTAEVATRTATRTLAYYRSIGLAR